MNPYPAIQWYEWSNSDLKAFVECLVGQWSATLNIAGNCSYNYVTMEQIITAMGTIFKWN
jgi:hypothetical protein